MKRRSVILLTSVASLVGAACGEAKPPVAAPPPVISAAPVVSASSFQDPPEKATAPLRTGALAPQDHSDPIDARVVARHVDGAFEIVELDLGRPPGRQGASSYVTITEGISGPAPLTVTARRWMGEARVEEAFVYVRRPRADESKAIVGKIHTSAEGLAAGDRFTFRAPATSGAREDKAVGRRWAEAMGDQLGQTTSFGVFARRRLSDLFPDPTPPPPRGPRGGGTRPAPAGGVLVDTSGGQYRDETLLLMDTLTGAESVQQAIQTRRPLLPRAGEKGSAPVSTLVGPKTGRHPWQAMLTSLGRTPPAEVLADAVPADNWYVRARDLRALFGVLDETEEWGTPLATQLDGRAGDRELASRYETELGLGRGPLTRTLGPDVIGELAATGSDPYLREGSDVTLIFRVKSKPAFDAGTALTLSSHAASHGGLDTSSFTEGGVTVSVARSKDGAVRQHRASVGDLELVSNSKGGIRRVLAALARTSPSLSAEPDFRYMLARDAATPADVLAFAGDRFILQVAGPRQKIAESRRQMALAALQTPAYAALLHGLLTGQSPTSVDELTKEKLLQPSELAHRPGDPIVFQPGSAPRSSWGTPSSLTPLVDLEPVTDVSAGEKASYERFAQMYDRSWNEYVDPIALRVTRDDAGLTADLRVLPIVGSRSYDELRGQVGGARITAPPLGSGARVVVGIGADAELRRDLSVSARRSLVGDIGVDWLGDWAMIGAADRPSLLAGPFSRELEGLELPPTDEETARRRRGMFGELFQILDMPLFGAVQVKSTAAATIALVGLRKLALDAAPGAVEWGEHATYRGATIVRVKLKDEALRDGGLSLFYAMDGDVIVLALREGILRSLLDDRRDGRSPAPAATGADSTQLALDVGTEPGAVSTLVTWLLERASLTGQEVSRAEAWALLAGAPETAKDPALLRSLALRYLGRVPVPPDGGSYSLGPDGVRDPARGSANAPVFPALPVPGSPVEKTLRSLAGVRFETSFDDEPRVAGAEPQHSLHTRLVRRRRK